MHAYRQAQGCFEEAVVHPPQRTSLRGTAGSIKLAHLGCKKLLLYKYMIGKCIAAKKLFIIYCHDDFVLFFFHFVHCLDAVSHTATSACLPPSPWITNKQQSNFTLLLPNLLNEIFGAFLQHPDDASNPRHAAQGNRPVQQTKTHYAFAKYHLAKELEIWSSVFW